MTKFLKDGKPHDPRAARQAMQAAAATKQAPRPQQPQHLPVKQPDIPPPGQHRRAPAAAQEAYQRIMEQRARQGKLASAGQGERFIPEADVQVQQPKRQEQRPQATVSKPGQPQRRMAIMPMQDMEPQAPQPLLPPTESARTVESKQDFVLDDRFQEVYLPSLFLPYEFKRIYVRQLTRSEIKAIIRAKASGSYRHLVNAVGQTINVDPYTLTIGDFWYLMYWHRINSYKKTPFLVTWECKEQAHIIRTQLASVDDPGYLPPKSVHNELQIDRSNLQEVNIDQDKYVEVATRILNEYGLQVTPQTVADFADMMEAQEEDELRQQARQQKLGKVNVEDEDQLLQILTELQEEVADAEVRLYGFRHAAVLARIHGETLAERDEHLDSLPPEVDQDLEEFIKVSDHGVNETFKVKCEGCGASKEIKCSLDALSFLPGYLAGSDA